MKKKGVYTEIVGLIAVALIAASLLSVNANVGKMKADSAVEAMEEIDFQSHNIRHMLDYAASDAFGDAIYDNVSPGPNCIMDPYLDLSRLQTYYATADDLFDSCKVTSSNIDSAALAGGTLEAEVTVICEKKIERGASSEFSASINKKFKFSKHAEIIPFSPPGFPTVCVISITDNQSGLVEVTYIKY